MNKLRHIIGRKNRGNIGDLMGTVICLIYMLMTLTTAINAMRLYDYELKMERIARKAILTLEKSGTLSTTQIEGVIDSLEELGFKNIAVTINEGHGAAIYGEEVSLSIICVLDGKEIGLFNSYPIWDKSYPYSDTWYSVSKARDGGTP